MHFLCSFQIHVWMYHVLMVAHVHVEALAYCTHVHAQAGTQEQIVKSKLVSIKQKQIDVKE